MRSLKFFIFTLLILAACSRKTEENQSPIDGDLSPKVTLTPDPPRGDSDEQVPTRPDSLKLGLNDVSVLIPYFSHPELFQTMPEFQDYFPSVYLQKIDETLKADDAYADRNTTFARIGPDQSYFNYRLVSVRFDPCANTRDLTQTNYCANELRLVWQRVVKASDKDYFFDDNVLHSMHKITKDEFRAMVKTLKTLKAASRYETNHLPLSPSPIIIKQGPNSAYLKGLLELVKTHARKDNLKGLAFFANTSKTLGNWPMLRLNPKGDDLQPSPIPATNGALLQRMTGRLELSAPIPMGLTESSLSLENPRLHSTRDTDCASCHTAHLNPDKSGERYENDKHDLTALYAEGSKLSLQMFSYFDQQPKITPRVINTSAEICDYINSEEH